MGKPSAAHIRKLGREHMEKMAKASPPAWDASKYKESLVRCLNYYNAYHDADKKQGWAIAAWKNAKKDVTGFNRLDKNRFAQVGGLSHLLSIGVKLEKNELDYIARKYKEFKAMVKELAPEVVKVKGGKPKLTIQDRMEAQVNQHMAEFDGAIDEFVTKGKTEFNPRDYLVGKLVKSPIAKKIAEKIKAIRAEFILAASKKDAQLSEGYRNFPPKKMKKVVMFLEQLMNATAGAAITLKKVRKPRKRKEVPTSKVVEKVKFLPEYEGVKSLNPEEVIGKKTLWTFNQKYRRFMLYEAVEGEELSFKGTTLQNFAPGRSYAKCLRKPAEWFKSIKGQQAGQIKKLFEALPGKKCELAGRMNEDTLIYKAY